MTNKTKTQTHTPGPWSVFAMGAVVNAEGVAILISDKIPIDERKANARLIAASVDLLEAARVAYDRLEKTDYDGNNGEEMAMLRFAIAKAEGK